MKILFIPNWRVKRLSSDSSDLQAPDKVLEGRRYWFFRYFSDLEMVRVIDFSQPNLISKVERWLNFYVFQGLKAFFVGYRFGFIISHGAQSALVLSLLRTIFPFARRVPHVVFDIGSMNGARKSGFAFKLISFALRSKPYCIVHSRVILDNYKESYPWMVCRSRYIPFGVDVDDFLPRKKREGAGEYVLAFGYAKRDYPTLLSAWEMIESDVKLRLIGSKQAVADSRVETIDKVDIEELKDQIANALFVVVPLPVFRYSYGQMTFLQSMSMGKAVVVTKTPSSVDYLQDGEGALLVEPYDAHDMKEKIESLLDNRELLAGLEGRSRSYVLDNFSEELMAKRVEAFLQEIVSGKFGEVTEVQA